MKQYNILKEISSQAIAGLLCITSVFNSSCTKDFDSINANEQALSNIKSSDLPFLFTRAENMALWGVDYQVAQNLNADQYAQYFACVATYFPSDRYEMRPDWFISAWDKVYSGVVPQLQTIMDNTDGNSPEASLANIMWVYAFHRITDYWGPIPYFNAGKVSNYVDYDSQEAVYLDFFERLNKAITVLKANGGKIAFGSYDIIYGGNLDKWLRFANTLRLRLALRISKVNPDLAKTQAEVAVADGVFKTSPGDDALLIKSLSGSDYNGISFMSDWNEFRMSASMESVLKGYNDPRMGIYFLPSVNSGTYQGIRNGLTSQQLVAAGDRINDNSHVGARWTSTGLGGISSYLETPQNVMSAAEAYFLRAEGKLLGWNMGTETVQQLYENGIKNSMYQWGITNETAIANYINETALPVAPADYLNSPALTDVPVKFGTSSTVQLKQIALQKWLALFPDGCEAWADYRRGHYFNLYPVANSDNADLTNPSTQYIRRLTFLIQESQTNSKGFQKGIELLGTGGDKITTPLWWDKN